MPDPTSLRIIHYPDSRLRARSAPVDRFNAELRDLAARMLTLMRESKGVGLAAPQIGVLLRLFVMNPTGQPSDDRVLVNPVIDEMEGSAVATEGCLSIPGVSVQIRRPVACRIVAQDLAGEPVELRGRDLVARIWQHETDHLNGVLILDRMGPSDRVATRKVLRALEDPVR